MPVKIDMSVDSPKILLDEENSIFLIEGYSYPADAFETYNIVIEWINDHFHLLKDHVICEFKFKMISSASRKMIYEILMALENSVTETKKVQVHWYYEKYDEDMMEVGEDYADHVGLPFRFFQL